MRRLPIGMRKHPSLQRMVLAEPIADRPEVVTLDMLIGSDYFYDVIGNDHVRFSDSLILLDTKLGFVPTGRVTTSADLPQVHAMMLTAADVYKHDDFDLKKFWSLGEIGITSISSTLQPEDAVLKSFNEMMKFVNGQHSVEWLWKDSATDISLPENYELATGRLRSLVLRLSKTPEILDKYNDTIQRQLNSGIIETVNTTENTDAL